jgi:hypothetical protein
MGHYDEALRRFKERREAEQDARKIKITPVMVTDDEAFSECKTQFAKARKHFLDKCFLETDDFQVLHSAYLNVCHRAKVKPEEVFAEEWGHHQMDPDTKALLEKRDNERAMKEQEERLAEAKKRGEVPGQKKMIKDDGSVCEEATPAKKDKLTPENDPANPANQKAAKSPKEIMGKENSTAKESPSSAPAGKPKTAVENAFDKARAEGLVADKPEADAKKPAAGAASPGKSAPAEKAAK